MIMENYEQKYKAALGWMQCLYNGLHGKTKEEAVRFFPELKESEGEKIKELLKHYLEVRRCQTKDNEEYINCNHFLAWLEKQGKQKTDIPKWKYKKDNAPLSKDCFILNRYGCVVKAISGAIVSDAWVLDYDELAKLPKEEVEKQGKKTKGKSALEAIKEEKKIDNANKVEPKFHEGEWIVWQNKCYKVNYNGCGYELVDQNGLSTSLEYGTVDENAHIWDIIKDAEDGNVLVSDNIIFIFNRIHDIWIKCRCSLYEDDSFYGGDFDLMHVHYGEEVFPATKDQCDTLMKAMADAGWTFDFEKKELKELKKVEQNPAWNEEDDYNVQCLVAKVTSDIQNGNVGRNQELIDWLKSLKQRIEE